MSSLDMALGDIISKNRTSTRGGARGGARGGRGGSAPSNESGPIRKQRTQQRSAPYQPRASAPAPQAIQYAPQPLTLAFAPSNAAGGQWTHDLYKQPQQQQPQPQQPVKKLQGDTVHVSNLAPDVTDEDVREIFERIGTVKSSNVNFNSSGASTGTATVVFARTADAEKAVAEYDEAEVDGRVMKLKLVGTIVSAPVVVKKQKPVVVQQPQLQQLAFVQQPLFQQHFQQPKQTRQQQPPPPLQQQQQRPMKAVVSRGGASSSKPARGGRGASAAPIRGGAANGRGGRTASKPATSEDLDKEMDSYHASAAPAEAPSAAAAGQPVTV